MVDWNSVRAQFPAITKQVYLNTASAGPISKVAAQEAKDFYDDVLMNGDSNFEKWLAKTENVREKVAQLINADKSEIAFIPNTSYGMSVVAAMLEGAGDVLTMEDEFPSSTIPWLNKWFRLQFVKPRNNTYSVEEISRHVTKETKILVTSHVQYGTGFRQDLEELGKFCKARGMIYVVNATQSIGAMPIDVKKAGIDFLVFSSVKWALTGSAIGAVYISRKWHSKVRWPVAGWLSVKKPFELDNKNRNFKNDASRLETGGLCFPDIFALGKAIDTLNDIGKQNVEKRICELNDYMVARLRELDMKIISPLDEKYRSGITAIKLKNPEKIAKELLRRKIVVSARKDLLRVSVHIYNNANDIDRFVGELGNILQ